MQRVDPSVEGLYESKVPLDFRAICELGCVCSVVPSARSHNIAEPWDLSQLERKPAKEISYLPELPRVVYLYVSRTPDAHRAAFGLVLSETSEVHVSFYTSFTAQTIGNTRPSFVEGAAKASMDVSEFAFSSNLKFNYAEAADAIRDRILTYKQGHPGAVCKFLSSPSSRFSLVSLPSFLPRFFSLTPLPFSPPSVLSSPSSFLLPSFFSLGSPSSFPSLL
jgi:hypothetical protein